MGKIIVGVDGSGQSRQALAWAVEEGRLRNVPVEAVYVYEYTPSWHLYAYGPEGAFAIPDDPDAAEAEAELARERALNLVDDELHHVGNPEGVEVTPVVIEDRRPARVLVERCDDADLLVIGSRGRGGFAGLLLGSVSQQCAQHAGCPVVIIGHGEG